MSEGTSAPEIEIKTQIPRQPESGTEETSRFREIEKLYRLETSVPSDATVEERTVALYRGDRQPTGSLSLSKIRPTANLGHGLYFLNSEEAARFYMGQDSNVGQLTTIHIPQSVMARVLDVNDQLPQEVIDEIITSLPPEEGAKVKEEFSGRRYYAPKVNYNGLLEAMSAIEGFEGSMRSAKSAPLNAQAVLQRVLSSHGVTGVSSSHQKERQYSFWNEEAIQRLQRGESWSPTQATSTALSTTNT